MNSMDIIRHFGSIFVLIALTVDYGLNLAVNHEGGVRLTADSKRKWLEESDSFPDHIR